MDPERRTLLQVKLEDIAACEEIFTTLMGEDVESRRKFIEGGLPAHKIAVKPNFAYPEPSPGRGDGGYAVYVGRLSAEKGIETLLNAWRSLGNVVPLKIASPNALLNLVAMSLVISRCWT